MPLGVALQKRSSTKSTPEGLKPQECERSSGWSKPPISYIPEKDTIQDTTHDLTLKIKVSDKMQLIITVFHLGTPEHFLGHVQMTLKAISQWGLDVAYKTSCKEGLRAGKAYCGHCDQRRQPRNGWKSAGYKFVEKGNCCQNTHKWGCRVHYPWSLHAIFHPTLGRSTSNLDQNHRGTD